jgi:hypothetical protein
MTDADFQGLGRVIMDHSPPDKLIVRRNNPFEIVPGL